MANEKRSEDFISSKKSGSNTQGNGPFLAKVISHMDPTYMGMLEVELLREVGNSGKGAEGQLHQVRMITPFYGVTSPEFLGKDPDDHDNTQKSYGMWFVPPDVGTTVLVFFVDGNAKRGFWFGCVPDEGMNFMIPGLAATELVVEGKNKERLPVSEYNKAAHEEVKDPTGVKKPKHPLATAISSQGLVRDDTRGITTSSCRREVPSAVFGLSTPGPVDKRSNAKKGKVGKEEHKINDIFVSRLGGTTLVFDDGDDKFLRKKPAGGEKAGPPEYAAVAQGQKGGDPTLLHNELVRIRTRTGHQILLHNTEDLIYIGNARGTAWIELTSNGKIDIFSADSINIHTGADLNFKANRDVNFEAGRNINMVTGTEFQIETGKNFNVIVGENGYITVKKDFHVSTTMNNFITSNRTTHIKSSENNNFTAGSVTNIKSGGNHVETASAIHMNGPSAADATASIPAKLLKRHVLPTEVKDKTLTSILRRVPTFEPYPHHENLDPTSYVPKNTDRDVDGRYVDSNSKPSETLKKPAEWWTKANDTKPQYTASTDPFLKVKGAEQ